MLGFSSSVCCKLVWEGGGHIEILRAGVDRETKSSEEDGIGRTTSLRAGSDVTYLDN